MVPLGKLGINSKLTWFDKLTMSGAGVSMRSRFFASLRMTGSWNWGEVRPCLSPFRMSLGEPALGRWPL